MTVVLCHTCRHTFTVDRDSFRDPTGAETMRASHDHALDEHLEQLVADPGSLEFSDITAKATNVGDWMLAAQGKAHA